MNLAPIKYLLEPSIGEGGGGVVEYKSVLMSMIKKGNRKNCIVLAEFTLSRVAFARGEEHAFDCYDDGT